MREAELSRGEEVAILQLSLAVVRPGADPRPLWLAYCAQWRRLAVELAAEPTIDTEASQCL